VTSARARLLNQSARLVPEERLGCHRSGTPAVSTPLPERITTVTARSAAEERRRRRDAVGGEHRHPRPAVHIVGEQHPPVPRALDAVAVGRRRKTGPDSRM
jgi:hypothetical protein